jgi:hypothetical protein
LAKGRNLPDWYLEEPVLLPGEDFYINAFWDLSTCRQIGMDSGPIPWDKIHEYGLHTGLDDDILKMFVSIIRTMDTGYLDWQTEQTNKGGSKSS